MIFLRKAMSKDLEYWKRKLIGILNKAPMSKSIEEIFVPDGMLKSLDSKANNLLVELMIKARGYAVGTIREWSGKKYKKLNSGKWMRTYTGTGERGEQQAIRNVMRKIQNASSMEELSKIVSANMQRFKGEDGKTLPIVKEFMGAARGTSSGKKRIVVKEPKKDNIIPFPKKPMTNEEIGAKAILDNLKGIAEEFEVPLKTVQELSDKYKKDYPRRKPNIDTIRNLVKESIIKETEDIKNELDKTREKLKKIDEAPSQLDKIEKKIEASKKKLADANKKLADLKNKREANTPPTKPITKIGIKKPVEKKEQPPISFKTPNGTDIEIYKDKNEVKFKVEGKHKGIVTWSLLHDEGKDYSISAKVGTQIMKIGVSPKDANNIRSWFKISDKDIKDNEKQKMDNKIKGYSKLKEAYANRANALEELDRYMERGYEEGMFTGDKPDMEKIENNIKDLEKNNPIAKEYISYMGVIGNTDSAYQSRKAGQALLEGATLKEAEKIANDWDKWI